jgi:hypothetical protein
MSRLSVPAGYSGLTSNSPRIRNGDAGSIRINHQEYFAEMKTSATSGDLITHVDFIIGGGTLSFLDTLGKSFERYKIHSCTILYRTSVGTNSDGAVWLGIDWDINRAKISATKDVAVLSPNRRAAVWQEFEMPIPSHKLMTRQYYICEPKKPDNPTEENTAFILYYACKGVKDKAYGDLWVHYDITLEGPRSAS